jgi:hypothetical protein
MSLSCHSCAALIDGVDRCLVYHNPDDGFALYQCRCEQCSHESVGRDPEVIAALLAAGAREVRLERTDLPRPQEVEQVIADLHALLDGDDWMDAMLQADRSDRTC